MNSQTLYPTQIKIPNINTIGYGGERDLICLKKNILEYILTTLRNIGE